MSECSSAENTWQIKVVTESEECSERYRKWNPPKEGWYCRETDKQCSVGSCPCRDE